MKDLNWLKEEVVEVLRPSNTSGLTWATISDNILKLIEQVEQPDPSDELRYHILRERHKEDATISMIIFEAYIEAGFTEQEALEILINMMIGG